MCKLPCGLTKPSVLGKHVKLNRYLAKMTWSYQHKSKSVKRIISAKLGVFSLNRLILTHPNIGATLEDILSFETIACHYASSTIGQPAILAI